MKSFKMYFQEDYYGDRSDEPEESPEKVDVDVNISLNKILYLSEKLKSALQGDNTEEWMENALESAELELSTIYDYLIYRD